MTNHSTIALITEYKDILDSISAIAPRTAITTKFICPTNLLAARITAKCDAGRTTMPYDYRLSPLDNHRVAAAKLIEKLGWKFAGWRWECGAMSDGGYVFVNVLNLSGEGFADAV